MTVNTTWVSPVSATLDKTTGNTIDETMTDALASNFYFLGGVSGYIGCRVYNNANLSIATATPTALTFNTEHYDVDPNGAIHSTSVDTGRLTCRTAGLYHVCAHISWASNSTGYRSLAIRWNGTTTLASVDIPAVNGAVQSMSLTTQFFLSATDFVDVVVAQTSGGALNVLSSANYSPEFAVMKA